MESHVDANAQFGAVAQAVFQIIGQVATYDVIEHESNMASAIKAQCGDSPPTPGQVVWALVDLLNDSAKGRNLELTMQALGYYNGDAPGDFWRESPVTPGERLVVLQAETLCRRMAGYLVQLCHRPRHGLSEAY